jgi:hypothetical protein
MTSWLSWGFTAKYERTSKKAPIKDRYRLRPQFGDWPLVKKLQHLRMFPKFAKTIETARKLIAQGADVNVRDESGNSVLLTAVRPYGTGMVQLLVDSGAEVNAAGALEDTLLISAARKELPDIVQYLKQKGAVK